MNDIESAVVLLKKAIEYYDDASSEAQEALSIKEMAMETIAHKLREYRRGKGLTLREMGKKLGVSAVYICDIEHAKRNISSTLLEKLRSSYRGTATSPQD